MAIQIVPILKTLAPLVANASGIVANLKSSRQSTVDMDERLRRIEEESINAGEILSATTRQLEAVARQLKVQADLNESYERRLRQTRTLAIVAVVLALGALALAFVF